jgi:hypothetical protein
MRTAAVLDSAFLLLFDPSISENGLCKWGLIRRSILFRVIIVACTI